jgi:hypothetical protein
MTHIPQNQDQDVLAKAMRAWTDGPKFLFVQGPSHFPAIKLAEDAEVRTYIGNEEDILNWFSGYRPQVGTFFMVVDAPPSANDLVGRLRILCPTLDIQRHWV